MFLQFGNTRLCQFHATLAFKRERLGHNADSEDPRFARSPGHNRCRARARAATHTGGHESHVRAGKVIANLVDAFLGRSSTHFRLRTGTQTLGDGDTHLYEPLGFRHGQCLCVGVGDNEINPVQAGIDHVVDGIAAAAAHTKHGNARLELSDIWLLKIDGHGLVLV